MGSLAAILPIIRLVLSGAWNFFTTTPGLVVLAAVAGIWWEGGRCREKAEEARRKAIIEQAAIAEDLAREATKRLEEEQASSAERTRLIEADKSEDANDRPLECVQKKVVDSKVVEKVVRVYERPCVIDDDFRRGLQHLNATARKTPSLRRTRRGS
jgi:hypothetical protein